MIPANSFDKLRADLIRLCGCEAADAFFDALSGRQIYVPKTVRPKSPVALVMGVEAARAFATEYGGCRIEVPAGTQSRSSRLRQLILSGLPHGEAAFQCGFTSRAGRMACRELKQKGLI